jgi:non-heme chloroperoxidase
MTHKSVKVSDNTDLHYVETGEGKPLLLVPGWSQSAAEFVHQIDDFSKFAKVFAIDMRGHGESGKPASGYRIQRLAKDLYDVIVRLGLEQPDVLGHSMGTSIIWSYLSMFGNERPLGRLVMVDQAPAVVAQPGWDDETRADAGSLFADFEALAKFEAGVVAASDAAATKALVRGMFTSSVSEDDLDWIASENIKLPRLYAAELHHDHVSLDWRSEIGTISNRTLVIGGDVSIFSAQSQRWIAAKIPGARIEIFGAADKGSHFMFFENAAKFNGLVQDFLAE